MLVNHQLLLVFLLVTGRLGERVSAAFIGEAARNQYYLNLPAGAAGKQRQRITIIDSDSVWVDRVLLSKDAYSIDHGEGIITFYQPLPELAVIRVIYWILTIDAIESGGRMPETKVVSNSEKESVQVIARLDSIQYPPAGQWQFSGFKTIGFSINNEAGVGINQQTRLSLAGQIDDLEIRGELSDHRLPALSEGTTLELEELEKVAISIKGKNWSGQFGDVGFVADAGGFGFLSREITGAMLKAETRHLHSSFSYARPKGKLGNVTLNGIEGIQGPYLLTVSGRAVQIIPGSEVVYLDGQRMIRGWDADYTIDYTTGELIFTNRNVITSRSRIVVEFQFWNYDYERTLFAGTLKSVLSPVQLEMLLFQEGDNPRRVLGYELTEEIKQRLASLEQNAVEGWISGANYVGEGNGDYILEDGHFRFTGANNGDYRVQFTFVGETSGAYVYDYLLGGFTFVGPGRGGYIDSIRISLPKMHQSIYTRAGYYFQGLGGYVEGALFRRNYNLFSGGRGVVDGTAMNYGLSWKGDIATIEYQHRTRNDNFDFAANLQDVEFAYRWGGIGVDEYTALDELRIRTSPLDRIALKIELGRLKRTDGRYVDRYSADGQIYWFKLGGYRAGDLLRVNAGIKPYFTKFTPSLELEQDGDNQERSRSWETGLNLQPWSNVLVSVDFRNSNYQVNESSTLKRWVNSGHTQLVQMKYRQIWKDLFYLDGVGGYQQFNDSVATSSWTKLFGSIHGGVSIPRLIRTTFDLNRTNRRLQLKDEIFRYVGPNRGNYKRDTVTGNYFPSSDGDYERVVIYHGQFTEISDFSVTLNTTITGIRLLEVAGSFRRNSSCARTGDLSASNYYDLLLTWKGMGTAGELTAGVRGSQTFDRTLPISGRKFNEDRQFVEYSSSSLSDFELRVVGERKQISRRLYAGELEYIQESKRIELSPVIGSKLKLEFEVGGELSLVSEPIFYPELGKFRLISAGVGIMRAFVLGYRTKLRPRAEITYRSANISVLPYDIALAFPLGVTPGFSLELDHLWSEVFGLTGRYAFSDQPERPPQHVFSLALRANF